LILAFAGVFSIYLSGRVLDGIWLQSSQPVVSVDGQTSELDMFVLNNADAQATAAWATETAKAEGARRVGVFDLVLQTLRRATNRATDSVVMLSPRPAFDALWMLIQTDIWLIKMHLGYAIIFGIIWLAVWALAGGGICRAAALHIARDEKIGVREAFMFAKDKFGSFALAPLFPFGLLLIAYIFLAVMGLIGALPYLGEFFIGAFFFVWLFVGFVMALFAIGAIGGGWLMFPTIAVEGSDAFDAISRAYNYVFTRPWRTAFYLFVSLMYGSICLIFIKFVVRLMLVFVHAGLGSTMNLHKVTLSALPSGPATTQPVLDALWQGPSPMPGETAFYGGFDNPEVSGWWLSFVQFFYKSYIYGLWGLVAAFAISFFYSACTMIYLLLRRSVDDQDMEDVYTEDAGMPPPATAPPPSEGGTSLPVIGQ
jgi:hypothetical protein